MQDKIGKGCGTCAYIDFPSDCNPCEACLSVYALTIADDSPKWKARTCKNCQHLKLGVSQQPCLTCFPTDTETGKAREHWIPCQHINTKYRARFGMPCTGPQVCLNCGEVVPWLEGCYHPIKEQ